MMTESPKALPALLANLATATAEYENATLAERLASSRSTAALSRLNEAQRALDAHIKAMRDQAPRESDWKRQERERDARSA